MAVLVRDDAGQPLAVTCHQCGRFTVNTQTHVCVRCLLGSTLEQQRRATNDHIVTAAADAWLREGRY